MTGIVATAEIDITGSTVETDWRPGSAITWSGEYKGQRYKDKGEIIAIDPPRRLEVSHFSPMSGAEDAPENYHRLIYTLTSVEDGTNVRLTQNNNQDNDAATHRPRAGRRC